MATFILCHLINGRSFFSNRMIEVYKRLGKSVIAVFEVEERDVSKYGIINGRNIEKDIYIIDDLVEKPKVEEAPSRLAIVGRYLFYTKNL